MTEQIPQPTVKVIMPSTRLRLEHITYLRNLASSDKKIRCELPCKEVSKLKLLNLIEEYDIPPDPATVKKHKEECEKTIERLKAFVAKEDWRGLATVDTYNLRRNAPQPSRANRITKAGLELLKRSEVTIKLQKGCA